MTPEDVKVRLKEIEDMADDDEEAHSLEDRLHQDVLREVARGSLYAAEIAALALESLKIDFKRWCA